MYSLDHWGDLRIKNVKHSTLTVLLYMSYQTAMMEKLIQSTQGMLWIWTTALNLPHIWNFVFKNVLQQYKTILTYFGLEYEVFDKRAWGYTVWTKKGRKKGALTGYTYNYSIHIWGGKKFDSKVQRISQNKVWYSAFSHAFVQIIT